MHGAIQVLCFTFTVYFSASKTIILFIDISSSRRKSSSGLTSGSGRQYVRTCLIRGSIGSFPRFDSWVGLLVDKQYGIGIQLDNIRENYL